MGLSDVIDKILSIGEHISDITLLPYQKPFARQIIRSVLTKDKRTITALFSRQCMTESHNVWTPSGYTPVKDIVAGSHVLSVPMDSTTAVLDRVSEVWTIENQPLYDVWIEQGGRIQISENHRFMTIQDEWKSPSSGLKSGDKVFSPLLPIVDDASEVTGWATSLFYLLGRPKTPSGIMMDIVGSSTELRVESESAKKVLADTIGSGYEILESGSFFIAEESEPTFNYLQVLKRSESLLRVLTADAELKKRMSKHGHPRCDVYCRLESTGEARQQALAILRSFGLDPQDEIKRGRVKFADYQSVRLLRPFLESHYAYSHVTDMLHDHKNWGSSFVHRDDWIAALRVCPEIEEFVRAQMSVNMFSKYRKEGLPFSTFLEIIDKVCPTRYQEVVPKRIYRRVNGIRRKGYGTLYDFETEKTGRYVAENILSHNCGKSEALTICILGIVVGLPALYKSYPRDKRFARFSKGAWVGVFAPGRRQAKNVYNRVRNRLKNERGKKMFHDLLLDYTVDQSEIFELDSGSKVACFPCKEESDIEAETFHLVIADEAQDVSGFKWRKSVVPMTTMTGGAKVLVGTANTIKSNFFNQIQTNKSRDPDVHFEVDYTIPSKHIEEYRESVEQAIVDMGIDSDEFRMAYRNQFIFERGMMLDPTVLDYAGSSSKGIIYKQLDLVDVYEGEMPVVMGIDVGKNIDSTVATAGEVDIYNPIELMGHIYYRVRILNWLALKGDTFDEQCPKLIMFMHRMSATHVVVDSTGVGDPLYDMLAKAMPHIDIERFKFSEPSKSEIYKQLLSAVNTKKILIPGGQRATNSRELRDCIQQGGDMEKTWRGQYMKCAAPNRKGAHDDYWDSMALMLRAANKVMPMAAVKVSSNSLFRRGQRSNTRKRGRR